MSQLTERLERDLREVAAGARPSPSAWGSIEARLADGTEPEPAHVLASARGAQKRPVWAAAVAAALLVIIGTVALVTRAGDDPSSFAADLTSTFVSPRHGFSIGHPEEAVVTPAEQLWGLGERDDHWFDVVGADSNTVFRGTSGEFPGEPPCTDTEFEPIPCGSVDEQIDRQLAADLPGGCGVPRGQQAEISIDGHSGRVAECANHIEATVVAGGRLYLFTLTHDRSDARAVFDAFVATIDLTPDTAAKYPGMTATFVSPTYGYSFKFLDRGGAEPATERWDPVNQPLGRTSPGRIFDGVETGYGAYFAGASTPIPDGVSIDEWIDEYVTPMAAGGCGVPRTEQAAITIDGHPGRVARCDHAEATVVASGRLYLFTGPNDYRRWFEAWIDTIDLTPETATAP